MIQINDVDHILLEIIWQIRLAKTKYTLIYQACEHIMLNILWGIERLIIRIQVCTQEIRTQ